MQPTMCSRCKKNVAVVFITRLENGVSKNDGLCLKCAKDLGIKPIDDMMKKMGITDEDLESLTHEMMTAFGGAEEADGLASDGQDDSQDGDGEEDEGRTATFPFLSKLFGGQSDSAPDRDPTQRGGAAREDKTPAKFLKAKPLTDWGKCSRCGACARACPVGSIDKETMEAVGLCIKCQACVRRCTVHAKYFEGRDFLSHVAMLEQNYTRRAENLILL